MTRIVVVFAALAFASVQAQAANLLQSPPDPVAENLPVEIVLDQQELAVSVPDAGPATAQFGLLGALIGSAVNRTQVSNGERRVAEMRNLLIDYPFNTRMEQALRTRLAANGTSPRITVLGTRWNPADGLDAGTSQDAIILWPHYEIRNTFEQMSVGLALLVVHREIKANGKARETSRFSRKYVFNFPMERIPGSGAEKDAQRWVGLGRDGLHALLDQGIEQVADMMAYDLSAEGRIEASKGVKRESTSLLGQSYPGRELRKGPGWLWVRTGKGWRQSLQGYRPLLGAQPVVAVSASTRTRIAEPAAPSISISGADSLKSVTVPAEEDAADAGDAEPTAGASSPSDSDTKAPPAAAELSQQ